MRPDQLQQPRMHGGPDGAPRLWTCRRSAGLLVQLQLLAEASHVLDRHDHLELQPLALAGVDDPDLAILPDPAQEGGDRLQRALGGRQTDPLGRPLRQRRQPLQAERQVGATLGAGDGVHLVDDHVLHAAQRLARLAGQHQVEALRAW